MAFVHYSCVAVVIAGAVIISCRSSPKERPDPAPSSRNRPESAVGRATVETDSARWERQQQNLPKDVTWRFEVPDRIRPARTPVEFRFVVHNRGSTSRRISFTGSKGAVGDVWVTDQAGRTVWSQFRGDAVFEATMVGIVVNPGDSLTSTVVWDQRGRNGEFVQPGEYIVRGYLHPLASSFPRLSSGPVLLSIR